MMYTYEVTVNDGFFPMNLTGEFVAVSAEQAVGYAKEWYAEDLGTSLSGINIVTVTAIK